MFGFGIDKKTIYIILGIILGVTVLGKLTNPASLLSLLFVIPGVLIAITFHEYAHAIVAYKLGDDTPKYQGRITLNPFAHLDPVGSILLLVAGFGWGKPVEINPTNFNRNIKMSTGEALVSLAGPVMNFILAIIFAVIYGLIERFVISSNITISIIQGILLSIIVTNIGLGIFNLIPVYPLDGSKIFKNILPYKAREWMEAREQIFYIVFIVLWISGILGQIITPIISAAFNLLMKIV
ncbi:MAG: site-2 protease family protein [Clostridia bacterium]|nr:site-2 protease family protein [Clostridia bacterium]